MPRSAHARSRAPLARAIALSALFLTPFCLGTAHAQAALVEAPLSSQEQEIVDWVAGQEDEMVVLLERLTNINTGTLNKAGVDEVVGLLNAELLQLGFESRSLPGDVIEMPSCPGSEYTVDVADHLLATKPGSGKRMLMIGHVDTVFPLDSPFQTFTRSGDTAYGPGVSDMKGGLVVMLYALKALNHFGALEDKAISILLNSDEEVGSLSSRKYVEEQAALHDYGLVYESSGNNRLTRARKGLGQARFVVNGRASHAGGAHQQGRSAIKELAYKIVEIENMTDYETGVTVNVGVISGGEARNTIAPCAEALVDLRYPLPEQGIDAVRRWEEIPVDVAELDALCRELTALDVRLGSHDDQTAEDRAVWRGRGARIAEFPETLEAAEAARDTGDPVILGSPNVVRGGSHKGNASAVELIAMGLCDALASDYHYPSPRRAALMLERSGLMDLSGAWRLVSDGPAQVLGLTDRGRLETGKRADIVVLDKETQRVAATLSGGRVSYMSGDVAARFLA